MNRIMLLIVALMMTISSNAQNAKFGKPSNDEWNLTSVSYAPDAPAVILYKSVDVNYKLSSGYNSHGSNSDGSIDDSGFAATGTSKNVDPETTSMIYDVKVRTKVLKESGTEFTTMDIITLNDKNDMNIHDEFYEMSIVVFSKVDGKVKKRKVTGKNITDERIDDYYCIRHVRIPDVKVGDIIEYQYKLFSNRITYIYYTQLQESIPVLYSKCRLNIPHFLQFNVNKPEYPFITASVALGEIQIGEINNDFQIPRKCVSNVFTIEGRELPAFNGVIDLDKIKSGEVYTVRTDIMDKRYDVKPEITGFVRHLIIGK